MSDLIPNPNRLIAVGDIHGHAKALSCLLEQLAVRESDTIVMLGDFVNRGPDSRQVIQTLIKLRDACHLVCVQGNHDELMLDSRSDSQAQQRWNYQGADETLYSYGNDGKIGNIPESHWEFLASCVPYFECDGFFFTHANYSWYDRLEDQPTSLLRWISIQESEPKPHISGKTAILGHTPGPIRDFGFCRCIDTGCGFGGLLTAMEVNTRQLWQATEAGAVAESGQIEIRNDFGDRQ